MYSRKKGWAFYWANKVDSNITTIVMVCVEEEKYKLSILKGMQIGNKQINRWYFTNSLTSLNNIEDAINGKRDSYFVLFPDVLPEGKTQQIVLKSDYGGKGTFTTNAVTDAVENVILNIKKDGPISNIIIKDKMVELGYIYFTEQLKQL